MPVAHADKHKHQSQPTVFADRWRPGSVIPVHNCAGPLWDQGLREAIANWGNVFFLVGMRADICITDPGSETGRGIWLQHRYEPPAANGATWHGRVVATNHADQGYLSYAAIAINDYHYDAFGPEDEARVAVLCHELGHALGAPHAAPGTGGCLQHPPPSEGFTVPGPWTLQNLAATYNLPAAGGGRKKKKGHHA